MTLDTFIVLWQYSFPEATVSVKMEVVLSSATDYGERYEEKELLGEGGFGKVIFRKQKA